MTSYILSLESGMYTINFWCFSLYCTCTQFGVMMDVGFYWYGIMFMPVKMDWLRYDWYVAASISQDFEDWQLEDYTELLMMHNVEY